jgi:hypothetical protein
MSMPVRRIAKIPEPILQLQQQLDQWRSAQKGRGKLPESFWQSAVDLATQFGVYHTAQSLATGLHEAKQRLSGAVAKRFQPFEMLDTLLQVLARRPLRQSLASGPVFGVDQQG